MTDDPGSPEEGEPSQEPSEPAEAPTKPPPGIDDDLAWLERHHHNRDHAYSGYGASRLGVSAREAKKYQRSKSGKGRRPHWYRPRNTIVLPLLVLVLLVAGFLFYLNHELGSIRRGPLNADYAGARSGGTNVLLIASNAPTQAVQADVRTMVVQLVHIGADGTHAALVDVPRDLLLPAFGGQPRTTLAARYLKTGASGVSSELQALFGITIEHVVQADYAGYVKATDRLGGIDVNTATGIQHYTGAQALAFVDQSSISSIVAGQRNQHWLRGMIEGIFTPGVLLNPFKIVGLLHDFMPNLLLDDAFTTGAIRSLAWHSRGLSPSQTRYLTVPHGQYEPATGGVVLQSDLAGMRQLGAAIRADNDSGIAVFDN